MYVCLKKYLLFTKLSLQLSIKALVPTLTVNQGSTVLDY